MVVANILQMVKPQVKMELSKPWSFPKKPVRSVYIPVDYAKMNVPIASENLDFLTHHVI